MPPIVEAVAIESKRTIDIDEFVSKKEINELRESPGHRIATLACCTCSRPLIALKSCSVMSAMTESLEG
jgi:hypothetical protein